MKIRLPTLLLDDKVDIINRKQLKLAQSALAQLKK